MRNLLRASLLLAMFLAACGADATAAAVDVAGAWAEAGGGGRVIEFDGGTHKFLLHGPGPTGRGHDHFEGGYRVQGRAVVLTGVWESNQSMVVVEAALDGADLVLPVGETTCKLRRRQ